MLYLGTISILFCFLILLKRRSLETRTTQQKPFRTRCLCSNNYFREIILTRHLALPRKLNQKPYKQILYLKVTGNVTEWPHKNLSGSKSFSVNCSTSNSSITRLPCTKCSFRLSNLNLQLSCCNSTLLQQEVNSKTKWTLTTITLKASRYLGITRSNWKSPELLFQAWAIYDVYLLKSCAYSLNCIVWWNGVSLLKLLEYIPETRS